MFPDISCDDIFRIETPRLWLRWLRASDSSAVAAVADLGDLAWSGMDTRNLHRPGDAERFILNTRAANAAGSALMLAATTKSKAPALVGVVGARAAERGEFHIGCAVLPNHTGRGFASESMSALVDACFGLTDARVLVAGSDAPAAQRVLERCGFLHIATDDPTSARSYRRHRADWARGRSRRLPGLPQQGRRTDRGEPA